MRRFLSSRVPENFRHLSSRIGIRSFVSGVASSVMISVTLSASLCAQVSMLTNRVDNARDNANINETLLTPANVSKVGFGRLLSVPVDYVVMAQPLYVAQVSIPGQGSRNVVYVVTQADSVYAIDADTGAQLWYASMLDGGTTASGIYLPCGTAAGFSQEGIVGTPVIDSATNTMYLVAKTVLNATVRHQLHALDITTGAERAGSPVLITATSTSSKGHKMVFNSLHQKNRPGLLLMNGTLYLGFGSNYCNDGNSGWLISYDETTLSQQVVFNTSPDYGFTSIWQAGVGLTADEAGNIFAETAEVGAAGTFDVTTGGQTYCNSVLKLSPDLSVADYFTPGEVAFLNTHDFDLSSTGALALPDQPGPYPHELIASGKQGIVYVLNRDDMGLYSASDAGVIQEVPLVPNSTKDIMFGSPAYWNNTVYYAPNNAPLMAFPLTNGLLGTPLTTGTYVGSHSPSISANGSSNGIMWVISGPNLYAFNATTMQLLYSTNQAPNGRDKLPAVGHFVTQTVANGKVYVATKTSLEVYGLFDVASVTGGNAQSGTVNTTLANPVTFHASNPYTGQPAVGVTVTFSDGCKVVGSITCGTLNPASAVTDVNGNASTSYTLPKKAGTYTLTMSGNGFASAGASATAKAGAASKLVASSGSKQSGSAGSTLPQTLVVEAEDLYSNPVSQVTINFSANNGGVVTPTSALTAATTGKASTTLRLPNKVATVTVMATSGTIKTSFIEYSVAGAAANIAVTGGNNQSAAAGTLLPQALAVLVTDQYGNGVAGNSVMFSDGGAGGTFSGPNPATTGSSGTASESYTLPLSAGTVTISATATGVSGVAVFTETAR
jgi:hypothetical protein